MKHNIHVYKYFQERPSIYDAMTSSRHRDSKFAAVRMAKTKTPNKRK